MSNFSEPYKILLDHNPSAHKTRTKTSGAATTSACGVTCAPATIAPCGSTRTGPWRRGSPSRAGPGRATRSSWSERTSSGAEAAREWRPPRLLEYREVQLDSTPELEVFDMLFEICHIRNSIKNTSISGVKFSWTTL